MLDFATINNRHGLETAVWMPESQRRVFITRRKCVRPGIIQQQEGDLTAARLIRKE